MMELFVVLAVIYLAFIAWYVYESSYCDRHGHEYYPFGGVFFSYGRGKHGYFRTYRCIRCGKQHWNKEG